VVASYLIVDVRESDYVGGHIRGSINIPFNIINTNKIEEMVTKYSDYNEYIIFHCMQSMVRGPTVANRFYKKLKQMKPDAAIKVCVMAGGFIAFIDEFVNLVDEYDKKKWGY